MKTVFCRIMLVLEQRVMFVDVSWFVNEFGSIVHCENYYLK